MEIFSSETITARQARITQVLKNEIQDNSCVLIFAGEPIQKPGGHDQTYSYLPHPLYFWLTGSRRPGGIIAYSKKSGWVHFQVPISNKERIWEGVYETLSGIDRARVGDWLKKLSVNSVLLMGQPSVTDLSITENSGQTSTLKPDHPENFRIFIRIETERRKKDAAEVALIQKAAQIAKAGYIKFESLLNDGISERELQVEYEAEVQRHGAHKLPYDTIIGAGPNSAILHAIPTARKLKKNEIVLIDAGVDLYDYCVDITRCFPVGGQWSSQGKDLYQIVKKSHAAGVAASKAGTLWREVHRVTAFEIAKGLKDVGLLKSSAEDALESGAIGLFYPHGVGHLVGLRVRDTGSPENPNPKMYYGAYLRVDITLEENLLMTVEPGCYFMPALLNDPAHHSKFSDHVNFNECQKWLDVGGVRLEDDVLIQSGKAPINLTDVVAKL